MNWNDIPCFLAIAQTRTLAGAARSLGVNHSTVFRRLNALEKVLGVRLFDRLVEGYTLTEAGKNLLEHAYDAHAAVDALARTAAGEDQSLAGDVRLTAAPNIAVQHIPPALTKLRKRHPGIRVEVVVSDSDYDLARREADIALRATQRPPDYLVGRKVTDLTWYVVAKPSYLKNRGIPKSMDDLQSHLLIGADQSFQRLEVFRRLHRRFSREQFVTTSNSLSAMASMAKQGLGVAVLPSDQIYPDLTRLFEFEPRVPGALWLLTHPDLRGSARIKAVENALYEQLSNDPRLK